MLFPHDQGGWTLELPAVAWWALDLFRWCTRQGPIIVIRRRHKYDMIFVNFVLGFTCFTAFHSRSNVSDPDPDPNCCWIRVQSGSRFRQGLRCQRNIFFFQKWSYTVCVLDPYKRHLINSSNTKFLQLFLHGDNFSLSGSVPNPDPHPIFESRSGSKTLPRASSLLWVFGRYYFHLVRLFA
jgi:hypothetical protein